MNGKERQNLLNDLRGMVIWNNCFVWDYIFKNRLCKYKQDIYRDLYCLELPNKWYLFTDDEKETYRVLEFNDFETTVIEIVNDMLILKCTKKIIKKCVSYCLTNIRVNDDFRTLIENKVDFICKDLNDANDDTLEFNSRIDKVYNQQ